MEKVLEELNHDPLISSPSPLSLSPSIVGTIIRPKSPPHANKEMKREATGFCQVGQPHSTIPAPSLALNSVELQGPPFRSKPVISDRDPPIDESVGGRITRKAKRMEVGEDAREKDLERDAKDCRAIELPAALCTLFGFISPLCLASQTELF